MSINHGACTAPTRIVVAISTLLKKKGVRDAAMQIGIGGDSAMRIVAGLPVRRSTLIVAELWANGVANDDTP